MLGILGGLASGLLGLISNSKTNSANAELNRSNQRFQHAEAELAYKRQRQLIQEQNDYNSFSNQRQLMENAGYNPYNLVGGTAGTAVSSSYTNAPQAGSPSAVPMQQLDAATLGALSDAALKAAQIKNINADTGKKLEETINTQIQNNRNQFELELYKKYGEEHQIADLDLKKVQKLNEEASAKLSNSHAELLDWQRTQKGPKELALLSSTIEAKDNEASLLFEQYLHEKEKKAETVAKVTDLIITRGLRLQLLAMQIYQLETSGALNEVYRENAQYDYGYLRTMSPENREQYFKQLGDELLSQLILSIQENGLQTIDPNDPIIKNVTKVFYRAWKEIQNTLSGAGSAIIHSATKKTSAPTNIHYHFGAQQ